MQTALSGYTGAAGNTGTDLITITGGYLDLAFTDAEGKALGDPTNANAGSDWSGLDTLDGRRIFLYTDSTDNNIVLGRIGAEGATDAPEDNVADPSGTIVFSAYLEQTATGAKVWMAQFAPLQNPVTSNPDDVVYMTDHLWATASQDAAFDFAGVPSGQNKFLMFKAGSTDVGLVVTGIYQADDREVFTFALTAATGAYVFTQLDQLDHPSLNGVAGDNTENDLVLQLGTILQATDADGDTVTAAAEKLVITVDDDSPLVTAKSNLVYRNSANPTPGGTGTFAYDIGADDRLGTLYSASNSDLSLSMTGVSVGANAITNRSVTWFSETDATAVFNIAFTYVSNNPNQGATTNATGTLTFDKVADTYTLSLTDEIESFSILRTSTAQGFTGYAIGGTTPINQQPPVSVAKLADDFFVQFSGFAEASGGTGANNIKAGGDNAFSPGELFSAATS
ncbi:DUF5801 repeats-in-toxin domain-containing protein [Pseudomonas fluorescens]|uniref:DUF5801 repeats-in-toxin domain-containing protein n=1 Tax=Pseudomonas fluorescens TaxID=294 RepID=UPI0017875329|nr:hypothetical protein [Pseudomonas fluorescens]